MEPKRETNVGDKIPLEQFLDGLDRRIVGDMAESVAQARSIARALQEQVPDHPDLAAQIGKLIDGMDLDLDQSPLHDRETALREARALIADLRRKWIAAENPPIVDKVDDRLEEIATALGSLSRADAAELRRHAAEIDRQSAIGQGLEGIEKRYLPWGIGAAILFPIGIVMFLNPSFMRGFSTLFTFAAILICLGALPAVAFHYGRRVLPRSRADARIEALNRQHFLPNGGIYFPQDGSAAGIIPVDWTPPPADPLPPDPRKTRRDRGVFW